MIVLTSKLALGEMMHTHRYFTDNELVASHASTKAAMALRVDGLKSQNPW